MIDIDTYCQEITCINIYFIINILKKLFVEIERNIIRKWNLDIDNVSEN